MIFREKPGKEVLEPEDRVKEEGTDETKDNEGYQVLFGIHFSLGIDSREAIDPSFHWNA
jgi:hypothetical protein